MNKKNINILIKFLVSVGFVVWIIFKTNWQDVLFYLREVSGWGILLYLVVLLLGIVISSYKWKLLADFKNIKLPLWEFIKLYITGIFINNFMPSFVAGDAYKGYQIAKKEKKYAEAASTIIVDRVTGFAGATILTVIFGIFNFNALLENRIILYFDIGLFLFFISDFAIAGAKKIGWIKRIVLKILPEKVLYFVRELQSFNSGSKILWKAIILGMSFSFVGVGILNYILFVSLGIKIGLLNYFSVIFITAIISALPISINNIGLKEWSYITFFGLFGASSSAVVTVAIISRLLQMSVSFVALPLYLKERK